jgi:hypothetical protein
MSMFAAIINTPGYLPQDDEPPTFETAKEAWAYLADERQRAEDDATVDTDTGLDIFEYTDTLTGLRYLASAEHQPGNLREDWITHANGTGNVYGNTPGRSSDRDLGLVYSVIIAEDES